MMPYNKGGIREAKNLIFMTRGPRGLEKTEICMTREERGCKQIILYFVKLDFHQLGPLGRVGQSVDMSVCLCVPFPCDFF